MKKKFKCCELDKNISISENIVKLLIKTEWAWVALDKAKKLNNKEHISRTLTQIQELRSTTQKLIDMVD